MGITKKQLVLEAKQKGFTVCMGHDYTLDRSKLNLDNVKIEKDSRDSKIYQYNKETKTLTYFDSVIYVNGIWAEIIKLNK